MNFEWHSPAIRSLGAALAALIVLSLHAADEQPAEKHSKKKASAKDDVVFPIQGFEAADIFEKKAHVSYLSGVPEEAEVEIWTDAARGRRKIGVQAAQTACAISRERTREGKASLAAKFDSAAEWLRVSLRNDFDRPDADRPQTNALGFFDYLEGHIFNAENEDVALAVRVVGGFAVTDKTAWPALEFTQKLKPGWNRLKIGAAEASAALANPVDATAVEFRVEKAAGQTLHFDNFRMVAAGLGKALAAHAQCFDFGVRHFLFPGFTYGSERYAAERGFGFTAGDKLTHGGDPHILDDALTRDGFDAPAAFRLDLPNGAYRVQLQTGNYWAMRDYGADIEIRAEGKRVWRKPRFTAEESVAAKHWTEEGLDIDRPDYDLWSAYQQDLYVTDVCFDVDVADGSLDLEWKLHAVGGRSIWTSMIVYPVEKAEPVEADIHQLRERIRRIYSEVSHPRFGRSFALSNREEVIAPEEMLWPHLAAARRAALKPDDAARARGYVHFLRNRHDYITPYSVPRPDETGDTLRTFAAQGQTAYLSVGLFPLRNVEKVSLRLFDFTQTGGKARIARERMDVRLVSYRCLTPVTDGHAEPTNLVVPGVLIHSGAINLYPDYPRAFQVSVEIPPEAPEGVYEGEAEILVDGRHASSLAVSLRVLPFKLAEPKDVKLAALHPYAANFWERVAPGTLAERFPELEFYKRMGLNAVWYTGDAKTLPQMQDWGKRYSLEILGPDPQQWKFLWPEEVTGPELERQKLQGKTLTYQRGHEEGRHQRFTWGFWLWRSAVRTRVLPIQPNAAERVYYAHAGHQKFGPGAYLFPSREGVGRFNPSPAVWEVADGIIDYRYLATLEEALNAPPAQAAPPTPPAPAPAPAEGQAPAPKVLQAAPDAKEYLESLRQQIGPGLRDYYFRRQRNFNHVGRWGVREGVWCGQRYDNERWEAARRIAAGTAAQTPQAAAPGKRVAFVEFFGPRFAGDEEYWQENLNSKVSALDAKLVAETPKVLATRPLAAIVSYFDGELARSEWTLVIRGADGKEVARETLGKVGAIKTRWLIDLAGLPEGKYSLALVPAAGGADAANISTDVLIIPGY